MTDPVRLILSCEHGGNEVPPPYRHLFAGRDELLATHRGLDLGILPLARSLAAHIEAPLHAATVTRLLVDLNRSPHSPTLFSEATRGLHRDEKAAILDRYYHPFRRAVQEQVRGWIEERRTVLHLSVHSFTPELAGAVRRADIGLLYDPAHPHERRLCASWKEALNTIAPTLRTLRNSPYRGVSDSLVTWLRRRLPAEAYLGIEIEVNQRLLRNAEPQAGLAEPLCRSLELALPRAGLSIDTIPRRRRQP